MPHSIRLLGPWQLGAGSSQDRVDIPADLTQLVSPDETATLHRRFNRPTGLSSSDRVRIELILTGELKSVEINGQVVKPTLATSTVTYDVSEWLQPNNGLTVTIRRPGDGPVTLDSCVLVIEEL